MAKYRKTKDEVNRFLEDVKAIILKGTNLQINNKPWKGNRVNTLLCAMSLSSLSSTTSSSVLGYRN